MNKKQKIIYLVVLSMLIISVVFLPCFAFADTLEDYGESPIADTKSTYDFELVDMSQYDLPMYNIFTKIPYSDNDPPNFSLLYLKVEINTFYGDYSTVLASNLPQYEAYIYDIENDPDEQDALAFFNIVTFNNDGFYAFNLYFDNVSGLEEIDTDTSIRVTLSVNSLVDPPVSWDDYWDGYLDGYDQGYSEGMDVGKNLGGTDLSEPLEIYGGIFKGVGALLDIELFPGLSIGLLVGIPLIFTVTLFIIHMVRG